MKLTRRDEEMLDGRHGAAKRRAMEGLVTLGRAYGAEDMVDIGYAHIHAGMAMYKDDVELMEELADAGATVVVPSSANIANADTVNWRETGAPEPLARLQQRATGAHRRMGSACSFTCTPYWAGHWPTWNMHMVSIESTVTIFCNSVLGARSNRDGFFAVYAAMVGRYPRFGYHLDEQRLGTHLVHIACTPESISDFSALGFHVGREVGGGVAVFEGFSSRPSLDELDALGAALGTSGGVSMFVVPASPRPMAASSSVFRTAGRTRRSSPIGPASAPPTTISPIPAPRSTSSMSAVRTPRSRRSRTMPACSTASGSRTASSCGSPPRAACATWRPKPACSRSLSAPARK